MNTIRLARVQVKSRAAKPIDEANGPGSNDRQHACHHTLPWLISFSLGLSMLMRE